MIRLIFRTFLKENKLNAQQIIEKMLNTTSISFKTM